MTNTRGGRLRGREEDKQCNGSKKRGFCGEKMGIMQQPAQERWWGGVRTRELGHTQAEAQVERLKGAAGTGWSVKAVARSEAF